MSQTGLPNFGEYLGSVTVYSSRMKMYGLLLDMYHGQCVVCVCRIHGEYLEQVWESEHVSGIQELVRSSAGWVGSVGPGTVDRNRDDMSEVGTCAYVYLWSWCKPQSVVTIMGRPHSTNV